MMPIKIEKTNIVRIISQDGLVTTGVHMINRCINKIVVSTSCPDIDSRQHEILIPHDGSIKALDDFINQLISVATETRKYLESKEEINQ